MSLYVLKGSLSVEAALLLPFFMMILLACFSFFIQFSSAADLKVKAAAEAKNLGIAMNELSLTDSAKIVVYKSAKTEPLWIMPFVMETKKTEKAVCRAWVGFTEPEITEVYVYITPDGSAYHLYRECTHLNLSIRCVTMAEAASIKNDYGKSYRKCELCREDFGALVYITSEGDCYHAERSCSGLKRSIRRVPISQAAGRTCCQRCMSREE